MQADYPRIWPYVIAGLAVLVIYRRFRRSVGRQPLRPFRMRIRIGILIVLGLSLLPLAFKSGQFLVAEAAGIIAGTLLGLWGANRTRYAIFGGELHYIPHTITGIAVSLLLIGRLVYRLVVVYSAGRSLGDPLNAGQDFQSSSMLSSPLTGGLMCVLVGYYVCYYSMVLWKSKRISPEDLEVVSTPTAASNGGRGIASG